MPAGAIAVFLFARGLRMVGLMDRPLTACVIGLFCGGIVRLVVHFQAQSKRGAERRCPHCGEDCTGSHECPYAADFWAEFEQKAEEEKDEQMQADSLQAEGMVNRCVPCEPHYASV